MTPRAQNIDLSNVEQLEDQCWLLIPGKPASSRARKKQAKARLTRYKRDVRDTASVIFNHPIQGSVQITIYHFHKGTDIDMDNMEKPILDGLTGVAYQDDIQVVEKNSKRVNLKVSTTIDGVTSSLIPKALAQSKECVVIGIKAVD